MVQNPNRNVSCMDVAYVKEGPEPPFLVPQTSDDVGSYHVVSIRMLKWHATELRRIHKRTCCTV